MARSTTPRRSRAEATADAIDAVKANTRSEVMNELLGTDSISGTTNTVTSGARAAARPIPTPTQDSTIGDLITSIQILNQTQIQNNENLSDIANTLRSHTSILNAIARKPAIMQATATAANQNTPGAISRRTPAEEALSGVAADTVNRSRGIGMSKLLGALGLVAGGGIEAYNEYQNTGSLGRAAGVGAGVIGGGLAGAKAGALAGSMLGPIGIIGGSLLGGVGGSLLGGFAARRTADYISPDSATAQTPAIINEQNNIRNQQTQNATSVNPAEIVYRSNIIRFEASTIQFNGSVGTQTNQQAAPSVPQNNMNPGASGAPTGGSTNPMEGILGGQSQPFSSGSGSGRTVPGTSPGMRGAPNVPDNPQGPVDPSARAGLSQTRDTRGRVLTTTETNLPVEARALLDTIGETEAPDYNVIYGGGRFNDFSQHPNVPVTITSGVNQGRPSTAAGRYQFLRRTWDETVNEFNRQNPNDPITDFSPRNQDRAAWHLAQSRYRTRTGGRNLLEDLRSNDPQIRANIPRALGPTWTSLPGGGTGETTTNETQFNNRFERNRNRYVNDINRNATSPEDMGFDARTPMRTDAQTVNGEAPVNMRNQSAIRNQDINENLRNNLSSAVTNVLGQGFSVDVMSGGQTDERRTGSTRHDNGMAADVIIRDAQGNRITHEQEMRIAQYWLARNHGSIGINADGAERRSFLHLDAHTDRARMWAYNGALSRQQRAQLEQGLGGTLPQFAPRPQNGQIVPPTFNNIDVRQNSPFGNMGAVTRNPTALPQEPIPQPPARPVIENESLTPLPAEPIEPSRKSETRAENSSSGSAMDRSKSRKEKSEDKLISSDTMPSSKAPDDMFKLLFEDV